MKLQRTVLAASITLAFSAPAFAEPPPGTRYFTDPQHSFVHDQTREAIGTVNMITCFFGAMNPHELVNQPAYMALVDETKCDENRRSRASNSDTSGGTSGAAEYTTAFVHSSRASNTDPMRVKAWIHSEDNGQASTIHANVSAVQAPSQSNPYGEFRLDFCGAENGSTQCQFQGYLAGSSNGVEFVERGQSGPDASMRRVYLTRDGENAGAGAIESDEPQNGGPNVLTRFQFAFDATHFRRSDGLNDVCFDRSEANSKKSVWRYGLYDHLGERVERASGFPIKFGEFHGYAGYHGVHLPQEAMNTLATGSTVHRQSFGDGGDTATPYEVTRARGRLLKYSSHVAQLANLDKVRFNFHPFAGLEDATANAVITGRDSNSIRQTMLEAYYSTEQNTFMISGYQNCGQSGCVTRTLETAVPFAAGDLTRYVLSGLNAHSQSFGGPVFFSAEAVDNVLANHPQVGASPVRYRTESLVYPGAPGAPTNLACVADCPTPASVTTFIGDVQNGNPHTLPRNPNGTDTPVSYAFHGVSGHLQHAAQDVAFAPGVTPQMLNGSRFGHGVRTGRLVPADQLVNMFCQGSGTHYCETRAEELAEYYVWEFGANPWNQFVGLRTPGTTDFVPFDPPMQVSYQVPNRPAEFGEHAGTQLRLSYNGFGELHGIPGHCVNPENNQPTDCGGAGNKRYVPAFAIPHHVVEGVVSDGVNNYFVKWLDRELRFARVASGACSGLTLGSLANLPSLAGLRNPADPQDPVYIGAEPVITGAPRVIHGVTQ